MATMARVARGSPRSVPASAIGKGLECSGAFVDRLSNAIPSRRILPADVFDDTFKVFSRFERPANLHLRAELLLDAVPHFLMRDELSAIKPF